MPNTLPKCGFQLVELWTPGNKQSPDGPARTMVSTCTLTKGHSTDHLYGEAVER